MTDDPIICVHIGRSTWQGPASAAPRKKDRMHAKIFETRAAGQVLVRKGQDDEGPSIITSAFFGEAEIAMNAGYQSTQRRNEMFEAFDQGMADEMAEALAGLGTRFSKETDA